MSGRNYVSPDVLELRKCCVWAKEKRRCRAGRYAQRSQVGMGSVSLEQVPGSSEQDDEAQDAARGKRF
jgi:hypothetical protein